VTASPSPSPAPPPRLPYVLAIWFGCGLVPRAPGTAGTLGALPLYLALAPAGPWVVLAAAVLVTAVGVWAAHRVAAALGTKDPQIVCIDEVAGVLLTLAAARAWPSVVVGVVLFRVLDMTKPWPARWLERRLPGGWGVMMDDVAAGAWGALLLLAGRNWIP
jgi:phosphatidylglycerophosphatase A